MSWRDRSLWRRDWSTQPNAWLVYFAAGVIWVAIAAVYFAQRSLFGFGHLALAAAWFYAARYTYRAARRPRRDGEPG